MSGPVPALAIDWERQVNADVETLDRQAEEFERDVGIPPCPAVLTNLLRETRADEPDYRRIGRLIANDVALAASVLKVANSPFYGLRTKVTTVQQGLTLLGLSAATQLVTGLLLRQAFPNGSGEGMERYWNSSMASGLIAALLARETGRCDQGTAHTYGLFRDCGMAVMMRKFPIYADILDGSALASGEPITEIEGERYATNHCRIGARLAHSWHLSATLVYAILNHHCMLTSVDSTRGATPDSRVLVCLGLVAEKLYCDATGQRCHDWRHGGEVALEFLGLRAEMLEGLTDQVKASLPSF